MSNPIEKIKPEVCIETFGCQMNKNDSELVAGILQAHDFSVVNNIENASIILINTCSVRAHAEQRVMGRLSTLSHWKHSAPNRKIGVLGCMAQRMKEQLIHENPYIDFVVGPDAYRTLPDLLMNDPAYPPVQTQLIKTETYSHIQPLRERAVSGWVTVMRGCNNFCSYCIVPYTRGRERSRTAMEIISEIRRMVEDGFIEVTLLGQNVNSYRDGGTDFTDLLDKISTVSGLKRIRFMTSHPKDCPDRLLKLISDRQNICQHLHLPLQAGSNSVLKAMNRKYTREHYMELILRARRFVPGITITTDVMVGFPGESETDFQDTLDIMHTIRFEDAYLYHYSVREGTNAQQLENQVPHDEKLRRLNILIEAQRQISSEIRQQLIGGTVDVLAESTSKLSDDEWLGKTQTNHMVVFPKENTEFGEIVNIKIDTCRGSTLRGHVEREPHADVTAVTGRKICQQYG